MPTQTLLTASQNRASQNLSQHHETNLICNLGFAWGVHSGRKGPIIDLPIFGFEGNHPYPARSNTIKQIGLRNLGFALGVCSGPQGPVIDLPIFGEGLPQVLKG